MTFFNRVGHVELLVPDESGTDPMGWSGSTISGLDFRFHVKKTIGGVNDKASVSILGLNRETISKYSMFVDDGSAIMRKHRVRVYAGYAEEGEHLILDGDVMKAAPTIPPENWLDMVVVGNLYKNSRIMTFSMNGQTRQEARGFTVREILDRIIVYFEDGAYQSWKIDPNGNQDKINAILNLRVRNFDCTGTQADIIKELNMLGDFSVRHEGNCLVISDAIYDVRAIPNSAQSISEDNSSFMWDWFKGDSITRNARVISPTTGLIGIPQYKYPMCSMTIRITSGIKIFDVVELQCLYNTEANGLYKVYGITYKGQLRGEAWYAKLTARNLSVPLTDQEKAKLNGK